MEHAFEFLGLPMGTWLIVGGLYFTATFLPTIIALILKKKSGEGKRSNE